MDFLERKDPGLQSEQPVKESIAWKRDEVRIQARDDPGNVASNTRTVH